MSLSFDSESAPKGHIAINTPYILSANWLYLVSMLLILSVGSFLQNASFGWGLLATEFLLILLPALLVLRLQRLPLTETLRLRWPGWAIVGLGLVAGVGLWLIDMTLDAFMVLIFGYAPAAPPNTFPVTPGQAILVFIALAISAPLCEEVLFRGTIQCAYEGRGRKQALIITSLLFAFFHFRLQGLVALLPVAFTLGYLRMRSNSLWPAVAAHVGNNAVGAIFIIAGGLQIDWLTNLSLGSPVLILGGLIVTLGALWLSAHLTRGNNNTTAVPAPAIHHPSWKAALPLALAALLYLVMGGVEFVYGRMPERIATEPLMLDTLEIEQETRWEYEMRNAQDEAVGQAVCDLTPIGVDYTLRCQTDLRAFTVELPSSFYQADDQSTQLTVQWRGADLNPVAGDQQTLGQAFSTFWRLESADSGLALVTDAAGATQTLALPDGVLLPDEWAWRFMALPFDTRLRRRVAYAWPSLWQAEAQAGVPIVEDLAVIVSGAEPVTTPAGNFIAWRVKLGRWTAWYDVKEPHTLLRYDAGLAVYVLTAIR